VRLDALFGLAVELTKADNLMVTWAAQDNYEIVRKVGRGKYSEVST
jgi:hypothetical protein